MNRPLDVLFIHPGGTRAVYQALRARHSARETPTWSLLLAQSCRAKGFGVAILDVDAEELTNEQAVTRIKEANPRLACFVVYGSEPNQGSARMAGTVPLCGLLKATHPEIVTCFCGSHTSALPREVLALPSVDLILQNEGIYSLHALLRTDLKNGLHEVWGIGWKDADGDGILNPIGRIVPQERMDEDLPGYAWDLLPYRHKPLDLYRSQNWHAGYREEERTPFVAIYSSLGCFAKCQFCMINIVNRVDNREGVTAADSNVMRYWSTEWVLREFDKLAALGVRTGKLSDEMFFFNRRHYEPMLKGLAERDYGKDLNLWAYARVDTVRPKQLELFRAGGIRSLPLGIESGNQTIRREVAKGQYDETDVRAVVKEIEDAGLNVQGNYIFGLPGDTHETMQETLDLSIELNTIAWNGYSSMPLPGSPLHEQAKRDGTKLPDSFSGYGFLSYDSQPIGTKYLTPADVLRFRDAAFHAYHDRPEYLDLIERKFGAAARANVAELCKVRLRRKLLGDPPPEA